MADGEQGRHARVDPDPDTDPAPEVSPQVMAENRQVAGTAPPKEPGWYPVRTNPNEQTYWDGTDWRGRRRWSAGTGWTEVGADAPASLAVPAAAFSGPRLSANPYAPHPTPTTTPAARPMPGVTVGILLLMASSIAMMVGSVTTWISSSTSFSSTSLFGGTAGAGVSFSASAAVSGVTDGISGLIGINGYMTLIAAIVVLVFAGLMAVSDDSSVRIIGLFFALASLGLSIYAVVRLAQKLNHAHIPHGLTVNIGWGVILTLGAAVLATLLALFQVTRSR